MSQSITITAEDILKQVKLSIQIPDLIESIISRKIITDAATEAGIKVETEELQKAADTMRSLQNLHSAQETFAWLEKHHLSVDDLEEVAYMSIISQKLVAHLFADKVEPYFYDNQLDYAGVVMYEVVLDDEDLAMELFYAIQEGEMSFYDVAHKYIQDVELRRQGGYRGVLSRKDLQPEVSAAVFAATPPQLVKPIVTSKGVHLILVEDIIQAELDNKLRFQIVSDLFSEWVKKKVDSADIIINLVL
ncbi:peptidylprolyl isomerase [Arthrospira platensis]|uniref:peptidylprolyl isomerase n=1 Tax=Limnospira TaxID=2596745 RepID=UPI0001C385C9|nr:peptidylprolyl isomerase [Arthrospira platensis]AMW26940.1 peptidylprolyl isomerase [Arthrospira platensis YZ]KDR54601.1 peptidylprolyl isomerase [Arthrospira platensis str. Paraca]MBD2669900.1 peptidylprolyl isomerase [Arthrospira platensis FACHB-439]MBD2710424.1 peptidylprolyl isomerase [Arthrospira platensis FACHB-835]MDF2211668.1 peptidylprolyl isomerase [Arthrospira platensis NCB002]MDT9183310.1 peptidylprolyl isomerase [Limnospira sp. PMC 289.06]MDT9297048.1 peptidylprolyl isomerase